MAFIEKKKRTKINSSGEELLPHDLIAEEILSRLPAKSLMRFKCVSRLWLSTIVDPSFCKSHGARTRNYRSFTTGLLIVSPHETKNQGLGLGFFVATPSRPIPPSFPPNIRDVFDLLHHQFTLSTTTTSISPVVNCLVCLYTPHCASLCSISTGEIMDLPPPPPPPPPPLNNNDVKEGAAATICYRYYIGFGLDRRFKVLRVCSIRYKDPLLCRSQCEILTPCTGETWRRLDGTLPIYVIGGGNHYDNDDSVYFNGRRYWWHSSGLFLVRFCFALEEFVLINVPSIIPQLGGSLLEFRAHVALVTGVVDRNLQMWLLRDDDPPEWSQRTLSIPYAFADRGYCLLGTLRIGMMLITGRTIEQEDEQLPPPTLQLEEEEEEEEEEVNNNKPPLKATPPIYSYDLMFRKFDELVIGSTFSSTSLVGKDTSKLRICIYSEDIRPLNYRLSVANTNNGPRVSNG